MKKIQQLWTKFLHDCSSLPKPLRKRCLMQILAGAAIAVIGLTMCFVMSSWEFLIGLAMGIFPVSMAWDTVRKYAKREIVGRRVRIISAVKGPKFIRSGIPYLYIVVKTEDSWQKYSEDLSFLIRANAKDFAFLRPDSVINVYINIWEKTQLLAWEPCGSQG